MTPPHAPRGQISRASMHRKCSSQFSARASQDYFRITVFDTPGFRGGGQRGSTGFARGLCCGCVAGDGAQAERGGGGGATRRRTAQDLAHAPTSAPGTGEGQRHCAQLGTLVFVRCLQGAQLIVKWTHAGEGRGQHEQAVREEVTALRDSISELQGEKEVMQGQLRALRAELKQSKLEQQRLRAQREVAVEGVLERGVNGGAETIVEECNVLAPCVAAAIPAPAPMATHMLKNMPTNMPRVGVARPALALRTESFAQSLPAPKQLIAKKAAYDAAWHGDVQMHLRHAF
eukprot:5772857-Pleurochrysis_carterae.AAC.1